MSFAHPLALLLLLLLIPIALLYRQRLRVPQVIVATGPFWQQALADEPFRAGWQRWRTLAALALHSLAVILLAFAAAGPAIPPPQRIAIILDNSATMRATDIQPSRFEAAKEVVRRMVDRLRWCDEMAIVTTSPAPLETQSFTSDRTKLRAAIDGEKQYGSSADSDDSPPIGLAVKLVREIGPAEKSLPPMGPKTGVILMPGQLPRESSPPRIVLITDASSQAAAREAQKNDVEVLRVGTAAGNRAITRFAARRCKNDPTRCDAFVEVRNLDDKTAEGKLEISIDGKAIRSETFKIDSNGRSQHLFDHLELPTAAQLTARITPSDAYPFDDMAEVDVPAPMKQGAEAQTSAVYLPDLIGGHDGADIRVPGDIGSDASTASFGSGAPPFWVGLAAAAAILLVLEWCLYHRLWTS